MNLVTWNKQKDGRTILGTAVHKYKFCPNLKRTNSMLVNLTESQAQLIPKCIWCFRKSVSVCKPNK
jgi:hypothetical protein